MIVFPIILSRSSLMTSSFCLDFRSWSGGEKIIPLTYEAAQKWAEEHLDGDAYEQIFGAVEEDDSRKMVALYLPKAKIEAYKRAAAKAGTSLTAYLEGLLDKAGAQE